MLLAAEGQIALVEVQGKRQAVAETGSALHVEEKVIHILVRSHLEHDDLHIIDDRLLILLVLIEPLLMGADELFLIQHDKLSVSVGVGRGSYERAVRLVVLRDLEEFLGHLLSYEQADDLSRDNGYLCGREQVEDISDRDPEL